DVLLGRQRDVTPPDVVLCIVDASNLQRNLYLVSQALEMNRPTVVALNMTDIARERGVTIDREQLAERLGVPVVEIQANRKLGLDSLKHALLGAVERGAPVPASPFPDAFRQEVDQ